MRPFRAVFTVSIREMILIYRVFNVRHKQTRLSSLVWSQVVSCVTSSHHLYWDLEKEFQPGKQVNNKKQASSSSLSPSEGCTAAGVCDVTSC